MIDVVDLPDILTGPIALLDDNTLRLLRTLIRNKLTGMDTKKQTQYKTLLDGNEHRFLDERYIKLQAGS